jgi:hypothetical protein
VSSKDQEDDMRADTRTISIDAPAEKVFTFVADAENLPRWAVGFAKNVHRSGDGWTVETGGGSVELNIDADSRTRNVDYWMTPAPGVRALAASRVIPRGSGCEYVFTQFQSDGMPDEAFDKSVQTLKHELTVLKALLEVECPL